MNPVSLYITTSRLVFQSGAGPGGPDSANGAGSCGGPGSSTFTDLNRLLPYLRKSLSCAVCCRLLLEPHTPAELNCQHHVCRGCVGERKKLKPSCASCKDYNRYVENTQLRMLLQCYKSICEYIKTKPFFAEIRRQASALNGISMTVLGGGGGANSPSEGGATGTAAAVAPQNITVPSNLWELIEEGARFQDNYRCSSGLTKSAYSILPCIYPAPTISASVVATQPMASTNIPQGQQMIISSSTGVGGSSAQQLQASKSHLVEHVASNSASSPYTVTSANIHTADHTVVQQQQQQQQQPPQLLVQGRPTPHQQQQQQKEIPKFRSAPIKTVSNGSTMYSVLYAGNGNKITIKRKTDPPHVQRRATIHTLDKDGQLKLAKTLAENNSTVSAASSSVVGFKMPSAQTTSATLAAAAAASGISGTALSGQSGGSAAATAAAAAAAAAANSSKQSAKQLLKRRGCRCGNATATPGKLTCCGQRCPCYVDSKSCVDCKCRGCRNPHRADGMKVRPHIPELQNLEINLHNANANEALSTATTTTVLATAPQSTSDLTPVVGSGPGGTTATLLHQQPQTTGLTLGSMGTLVSSGPKGLSQINLLGSTTSVGGGPTPGSTLKITPTSLANVLNSTNQLVSTSHDGIGLVPSTGLLDASGFSYLTPGSLDVSGTTVQVQGGPGTATQYTMPGTSLANGGTIHVVNVYTTHLGDVSCSPTLSNMIRTDSALNSLLTHKPPEALLTTTATQHTTMPPSSSSSHQHHHQHHHPTLIGHSLFANPTVSTTTTTSGVDTGTGSSGSGDLVGEVGTIVDLNDQIDLTGANLITIDGSSLDDRLHGSSGEDV